MAVTEIADVGEADGFAELIYGTVLLAIEIHISRMLGFIVFLCTVFYRNTLVVGRHPKARPLQLGFRHTKLIVALFVGGSRQSGRNILVFVVAPLFQPHLLSGYRFTAITQDNIAMQGVVVPQRRDYHRVAACELAVGEAVLPEIDTRRHQHIVLARRQLRHVDVCFPTLIVVSSLHRLLPPFHHRTFQKHIGQLLAVVDILMVELLYYAEVECVHIAVRGHSQDGAVGHHTPFHRKRTLGIGYLLDEVGTLHPALAFRIHGHRLLTYPLRLYHLVLTAQHQSRLIVEQRHHVAVGAVSFGIAQIGLRRRLDPVRHPLLQLQLAQVEPYTKSLAVIIMEVHKFLHQSQPLTRIRLAFDGHIHHQVVERRCRKDSVAVGFLAEHLHIVDVCRAKGHTFLQRRLYMSLYLAVEALLRPEFVIQIRLVRRLVTVYRPVIHAAVIPVELRNESVAESFFQRRQLRFDGKITVERRVLCVLLVFGRNTRQMVGACEGVARVVLTQSLLI